MSPHAVFLMTRDLLMTCHPIPRCNLLMTYHPTHDMSPCVLWHVTWMQNPSAVLRSGKMYETRFSQPLPQKNRMEIPPSTLAMPPTPETDRGSTFSRGCKGRVWLPGWLYLPCRDSKIHGGSHGYHEDFRQFTGLHKKYLGQRKPRLNEFYHFSFRLSLQENLIKFCIENFIWLQNYIQKIFYSGNQTPSLSDFRNKLF